MLASFVVVTVWLQDQTSKDSSSEAGWVDFGELVIAGYQTVLSQSTPHNALNRLIDQVLLLYIIVYLYGQISYYCSKCFSHRRFRWTIP